MTKKLKIFIDWKDSENGDDYISLLNFIDNNQQRIKKKYLTFINSINFKKEDLKIDYKNNFNIWQTSILKELSFYKSEYLNDVFKIFALKILMDELVFKEIEVSNIPLKAAQSIEKYFIEHKIKYNFKTIKNNKKTSIFLLIWNNVHHYIKLILFSGHHFYSNFTLITRRPIKVDLKKNEVLLFGYLAHLKTETFSQNRYSSNIWGHLPVILENNNVNFHFMDIYVKTKEINNSKEAYNLINKLNENKNCHSLIFSHLSIIDYLKTTLEFINLQFRFLKISKIFKYKMNHEGIDLYKFYKKDISKSFNGFGLFENLIWDNAFKNFFTKVKEPINVIYIQENHPWEFILLNNFRLNNKGKIFSLQNSIIRNWDLRYYNKFIYNNCKPDNFIVNGEIAFDSFISYGYPKKKIIKLESLRYSKYKDISLNPTKNKNSVLLLGDYQINETENMLNRVIPYLSENGYTIGFKPHPARTFNFIILLKYNIKIEVGEISNLTDYQNFIVPSDSGSSVDIFLLGRKPIIYTSENNLNNNPLSNQKDILNSSDKKEILKYLEYSKNKVTTSQDIFYLDNNFKRWDGFVKTKLN